MWATLDHARSKLDTLKVTAHTFFRLADLSTKSESTSSRGQIPAGPHQRFPAAMPGRSRVTGGSGQAGAGRRGSQEDEAERQLSALSRLPLSQEQASPMQKQEPKPS